LEKRPEDSLGGTAEDDTGDMILLDTNVIIDAHYGAGNYRVRARELISSAVIDTGAQYGQGYLFARPAFPIPKPNWPLHRTSLGRIPLHPQK